MPAFIDITSNKYGRLTVLSRVSNSSDNRTSWLCKCDCGNEAVVRGNYLKSGKTQSCGCYQKEAARAKRTKHGQSSTKEYTRETHLMRKYKLPLSEYEQMLQEQNNKCFICDYEFGQAQGDTYVDHCHKSGGVRGLLCRNCNSGIGMLKDNVAYLSNAINYLNKYSNAR